MIMEQYISKSAVVAEIKNRRDSFYSLSKSCEKGTPAKAGFYAQAQTLEGILSFLDTLEVKEETEWNEASIKPPFIRAEDGNKYSEPVLCHDKFGNYFIANYVRWRTGYYGWFSGDDEISITHWKELQ